MADSRFMRWAAAVGDFGSPFYREERQRDVWNEASAVGLQAMLWLGLIVSAAFFWIGGRAGLPYGLGLIGVVGTGALVTLWYAGKLGVAVVVDRLSRPRMMALSLVLVVYLGGFFRVFWEIEGKFSRGMIIGMPVGVIAGLCVAGVLLARQRRLARSGGGLPTRSEGDADERSVQ